MDSTTLNYYDRNAAEVAAKYRAVEQNAWRELFREVFPAGGRVLDVGTGAGRDLAMLLDLGFQAFGTEPSAAMRAEAVAVYPQIAGRIFDYGLPLPEGADLGGKFDGLVCSAVFQHVPEVDRLNAAFSFKRLLCERGRLWISVPGERSDLNAEHRDVTGRLFTPVHPEYLERLFERFGFKLIQRWAEKDRLGRPGFTWNSFLFELNGGCKS